MIIRRERFERRSCPVCSASRSKLLFRQAFERFAEASVVDGYDVVICDDCGAGFADDIPPQSVFDEYYRDMSKYEPRGSGVNAAPAVELRLCDIAALIAEFVPGPRARIFEIGCAAGGLLKALENKGFRHILGSDPSPHCIRIARERYGVPGIVGTIFTVPEPPMPYDFLVLTGVIEHIRDLGRAVIRLHELSANTGRVYLEVPDASRYSPHMDAPFQEFSVEHINFFSRTSLTNLMQIHGFRTIAAGPVSRPLNEVECPCVFGVFEKFEHPPAWQRDTETEAGLRIYIEGCQAEDKRVQAVIRGQVKPREKIIVWGAGTHTLRLLATGGLDPDSVAVFVDSNANYQGQRLRGVPVISPNQLRGRTEPILVSSRSFQREIQGQIRTQLKLNNRLILLYET